MQVLADTTAIAGQCRDVGTMFGIAFEYAEEHGVRPIDVLPLGKRRAEFQALYDRRVNTISHEELCGPLVLRYGQELPGLFTAR